MSDAPTIEWPGESGKKYKYSIYDLGTTFREVAGNYIYAGLNSKNEWYPTYIGQTGNLKERFSDHEKEPCARQNGATHLHVHSSSNNEQVRLDEETDLIRNYNPICND